jgi:hypothetical protein
MRSTELRAGLWPRVCGVVLGVCLTVPAWSFTLPNTPALNRERCLAAGNWYGFYHVSVGLRPICLNLPEAFSGKMLDSNDDGVIDNPDAISSGVIFVGEDATAIDNDATGIGSDSSGDNTLGVEKSGGVSRRIMWRQIQ